MAVRLEELVKGARVRGVAPSGAVTVIDAEWVGAGAVNLTYEDEQGNVDRELIYRSGEDGLEMAEGGRAWALDADPALFVLAAEVRPNLTPDYHFIGLALIDLETPEYEDHLSISWPQAGTWHALLVSTQWRLRNLDCTSASSEQTCVGV